MISLLSGLYQYLFAKTQKCVLIVGLDNAGKTTFLQTCKKQYGQKSMKKDRIVPTIGLNIARIQTKGCEFTLWDLGGQQSLRKIWNKYISDCHAVVFIIDGTDPDRFEEARDTLHSLSRLKQLEGTPFMVLSNKEDRHQYYTPIDKMRDIIETQKINRSEVALFAISALKESGIKEAIGWMLEAAKNY